MRQMRRAPPLALMFQLLVFFSSGNTSGASHALFPKAPPHSASETAPLWMPDDRGSTAPCGSVLDFGEAAAEASDFERCGRDVAWLNQLQLPPFSVRWDASVVRYLEYYKFDPRGQTSIALLNRRAMRFRSLVEREFRSKNIPEDLVWVAMIESGFTMNARSTAGACGLWQLMPETAKSYGLARDRWIDQRFHAEMATRVAATMLAELFHRFGTWELALAAYNYGQPGVMTAIRKYNTNDYWRLTQFEGALPWESTHYVPKIIAAAIVGRNPQAFGLTATDIEEPPSCEVVVAPGVPFKKIAKAASCEIRELSELNPELRSGCTPPKSSIHQGPYRLRVPPEKAHSIVDFLSSLDHNISTTPKKAEALAPEVAAPSKKYTPKAETTSVHDESNVVVVPKLPFVYPGRERYFYRTNDSDSLAEVAAKFSVTTDELCRWNLLDPLAHLQSGMSVQLYLSSDKARPHTSLLAERSARILTVGSNEFFAYFEEQKGRLRLQLAARAGDTIARIGKRFGIPPASMERINRRARNELLDVGESVIVYVPKAKKLAAKSHVKPKNVK